ncbi:MAG: LLM class flavin-dependent oxidoreductase [Pseudomonadales bacterium]
MANYSILDLVPITAGSDAATALERSKDLAVKAESWGYTRYWVAEHHNMPGIASSEPAVVIGHLAAATQHIRIGSGGIMLPNHAPLMVAEQFGTLATLFPNRIDLGLGRAPGTDGLTMQALRRNLTANIEDFPKDVVELQHYLKEAQPGQRVSATPGAGTNVPIWILGSSLFGAQLAAMLGLPFAFASHFAPTYLMAALETYRTNFKPSATLDAPYVMLGCNLCAADTDEEAQYLRSSSLQSFVNLRRGQPGPLPPPVKDFESVLNSAEQQMVQAIGQCSAVGNLPRVTEQLEAFLAQTDADELMLVSSIYSPEARLRSYALGAEAMQSISTTALPKVTTG